MTAFQLTAVSSCKLKLMATQHGVLGHVVTAEVQGPSQLLCYKEPGQAAGLCSRLELTGWVAKGYIRTPFHWASGSPCAL